MPEVATLPALIQTKKLFVKLIFQFWCSFNKFNTAFNQAANVANDIGDHSIEFNKYPPFHSFHSLNVTDEMVNKLIAGYLKFNNFDHTFFLFCKEAQIDENEIANEHLVEILKNSLLIK